MCFEHAIVRIKLRFFFACACSHAVRPAQILIAPPPVDVPARAAFCAERYSDWDGRAERSNEQTGEYARRAAGSVPALRVWRTLRCPSLPSLNPLPPFPSLS